MKENMKNPRAKADVAVEVWRDAKTAADAAAQAFRAGVPPGARVTVAEIDGGARVLGSGYARTRPSALTSEATANQDGVRRRVLEIASLRAKDAAAAACAEASVALDNAEVNEGDQAARARDVSIYAAELSDLIAAEDAARAALSEAEARTRARMVLAASSQATVEARRAAEQLPPPVALPNAPVNGLGFRDGSARTALAILAARIQAGPPAARSSAERIRQLEREETELRAAIEQARINREASNVDSGTQANADAKSARALAQVNARRRLELQAETDAERSRQEKLAAAHRAREERGQA